MRFIFSSVHFYLSSIFSCNITFHYLPSESPEEALTGILNPHVHLRCHSVHQVYKLHLHITRREVLFGLRAIPCHVSLALCLTIVYDLFLILLLFALSWSWLSFLVLWVFFLFYCSWFCLQILDGLRCVIKRHIWILQVPCLVLRSINTGRYHKQLYRNVKTLNKNVTHFNFSVLILSKPEATVGR